VPCQVYRLGDLLENLGGSPAGDLFIIEASKTTLVSGHRTNRGVSLVRADKECRPDYFVDKDDYSDVWLSHLNCNELHDAALQAAAKIRETVFPAVKLRGNRPIDHLGEIGLIRPMEETSILGLESFVPSMASLLLFGKEESLKAEMPSAETVVAIETAAISPLTSSNWYGIAQALQNYVPLISDELAKREMPIPEDLIRELVLNAYLHKLPLTKAVTAPYRRNEPSDLEYALLICTAHFRFYT